MSGRPESVLFGVRLPEQGAMTPGQRWTASLAVATSALFLAFGGGSTFVAQAPASSTTAPPAQPAVAGSERPAGTALPGSVLGAEDAGAIAPSELTTFDAGIIPPALPGEPPAEPAPFDGGAPPPSPPPEPGPSGGGGSSPPPPDDGEDRDEPPAQCATPAAPVLAGAGLCPPP